MAARFGMNANPGMPMMPLSLFYSYAHEDEPLRDELQVDVDEVGLQFDV